MLPNYSRVRLLTDMFSQEGVGPGAIGYIIEAYDDAYEVEFSDEQGITIAQIVARPGELELYEPAPPRDERPGGHPEVHGGG